MDMIYNLLQDIRKRPEIYIGKPSLELLNAYVNGYMHNSGKECNNCLLGFNEYIAKIYNLDTDHNWSSIIQFFYKTEEEAFNKFYEHLDNFLQFQK
jgi:hypothetical protein